MRLLKCLVLLTLAGTLFPARSSAQLQSGARVRFTLFDQKQIEGRYAGADSSGFVLVNRECDTTRLTRQEVVRIERFVGRERHGKSAVLKGFAIGASIPALMALSVKNGDHHESGVAYAVTAMVGVVTTVTGTLVGIVVAAVEHDVWQGVDP